MSPSEILLAKDIARGILASVRLGQALKTVDKSLDVILSALPDDTTDAEKWQVQQRLLGLSAEAAVSNDG